MQKKHTTAKKWDCQLGNPCAYILIQRSQLRIQSLEGIKGQDQDQGERVHKTWKLPSPAINRRPLSLTKDI
ncbi:hypothetical protein Tco_0449150 [Tanacetum coccineum]